LAGRQRSSDIFVPTNKPRIAFIENRIERQAVKPKITIRPKRIEWGDAVMENCSSIMMGAALAELNFAFEEANPRNANLQRSI
jgi:hypothetical protein